MPDKEVKIDKLPGWAQDENGVLPVTHVLGWETALGGLVGLIRIRLAQNPAQVEKGGVPLQLVLTPEQMRGLAEDLASLIAKLPEPGSRSTQ